MHTHTNLINVGSLSRRSTYIKIRKTIQFKKIFATHWGLRETGSFRLLSVSPLLLSF
jgi:hypothetical protein